MKELTALRIPSDTKKRLDKLAKQMKRTRSYVIESAIEAYLDVNEWQIGEIKEALKEAEKPSAEWVEHDEVSTRLT